MSKDGSKQFYTRIHMITFRSELGARILSRSFARLWRRLPAQAPLPTPAPTNSPPTPAPRLAGRHKYRDPRPACRLLCFPPGSPTKLPPPLRSPFPLFCWSVRGFRLSPLRFSGCLRCPVGDGVQRSPAASENSGLGRKLVRSSSRV